MNRSGPGSSGSNASFLPPPTPVPPSEPAHDPYAALRFRDFRLLLMGGLVTATGGQMLNLAIGWELYNRTGEPMALGLVGIAQVLPIFLFSLPAGQAADRFDRRSIGAAAQFIRACSSFVLVYLSYTQGPVAAIYACLFTNGVTRAFHAPARTALMPMILPAAAFANAVSWNTTGFQLASVSGPALGGFMMGLTGFAWPVYLFDALTSLFNVVCILNIHATGSVKKKEPPSLHSLLAGIRFVWSTKVLLAVITLDLFGVLLGGAAALLPVYAKDILHVGPEGLGWLRASESVGALLMAVTIAHRPPMRRAGPALLWSVTGFGLGIVVFGLSENFWLSIAAMAFCGACDNVSVVIRHTLMQLRTPDEMRGRVAAVNTVFIASSNELGQLESGTVAHFLGPVFSVVSGGIGTILVVLVAAGIWPEIRGLQELHSEKSEDSPLAPGNPQPPESSAAIPPPPAAPPPDPANPAAAPSGN
ncbi:MAG: MFS transporter [Planctomycetes bacterium]|nr:MFS transporter [Planctomycetota bacterium]